MAGIMGKVVEVVQSRWLLVGEQVLDDSMRGQVTHLVWGRRAKEIRDHHQLE